MEKFFIRHVDNVETVSCPCGQSRRMITKRETPKLNIHCTDIADSECHYHKITSEVYYVLKGSGLILLDNSSFEIGPGHCIFISPGVRHRVIGKVQALIVGVPAFDEKDEYFD
jgi:mannose-6-phosphate isomerase-like protein (cupin superfamily)